jgi:hypothetical protein
MKSFLWVLLLLISCKALSIPSRGVPDEQASADSVHSDDVRECQYCPANYQNQMSATPNPSPAKESKPKTAAGKVIAKVFSGSGKQKFTNRGTIINQYGTGNSAMVPTKTEAPVQQGQNNKATDNTKAGSEGGAAATGKGSTATATTKEDSTPWLLYMLLVKGGAAGGWLLSSKATGWSWIPAALKLA